MLSLKVPLKEAEKWKKYLVETKNFNNKYRFKKDDSFIYFPILRRFEVLRGDISFVDMSFEESKNSGDLKTNLINFLSKEELSILKASHDIIGTIAILEIPKELEHKEKFIAETLLRINKNIKTVLKKADAHEGVFRTQKMKYLAGINTTETLYKENNVSLLVDVEKVYFSIRLSNERKRIAGLVKPGEDILVMFSGAAPYPVVLSKNTPAKHILGIEINPDGHKYGLENIKINKCKNVELICGDVHVIVPELNNKNIRYDRIIMPLPKTADEFLDDALMLSKKSTVIHFYDFLEESNFDEAKIKISEACKRNNRDYRIINIVKCGQHAPRVFRICVDFEIIN
ncbi:MAG: tRNA (guanine-N1)-methyltransferase [Candidatus Woesearchaeota archaeon]|nr:MAG: tRNA (guanine-N1)-methyltransferase [Candidatus Woesearchaeota archaeon]